MSALNVFLVYCFAFVLPFGLGLICYSCQQGYRFATPCSTILPRDMVEVCEANATCIQAIEWFQNGSLQLVRRACWTGDFCNAYPKTGNLRECKSCSTDYCNNKTYPPAATCA